MASSHSDKEWLRKSIKDGRIQFYAYYDFIESRCIGMGRYGAVFKAKAKTLDRMIAYKPLHSENEDEMFENVVKQVCILMIICTFGHSCFTYIAQLCFQVKILRNVDDHPNIIRFLGMSEGKHRVD